MANNFADGFNKTLKNKKIEHIKVSAYVEKEGETTKTRDINTAGYGKMGQG